jgi:hypothetical protein
VNGVRPKSGGPRGRRGENVRVRGRQSLDPLGEPIDRNAGSGCWSVSIGAAGESFWMAWSSSARIVRIPRATRVVLSERPTNACRHDIATGPPNDLGCFRSRPGLVWGSHRDTDRAPASHWRIVAASARGEASSHSSTTLPAFTSIRRGEPRRMETAKLSWERTSLSHSPAGDATKDLTSHNDSIMSHLVKTRRFLPDF